MTLSTRLASLRTRHASLDARIEAEDHRPKPDDQALAQLKLDKLRLKDEMERLRFKVAAE